MNTKIKKKVEQVYKGHTFTTNDFIEFDFDAQKRLMHIKSEFTGEGITFDMTQHSMEMLYKLFKYILEDNGDHHGK